MRRKQAKEREKKKSKETLLLFWRFSTWVCLFEAKRDKSEGLMTKKRRIKITIVMYSTFSPFFALKFGREQKNNKALTYLDNEGNFASFLSFIHT